MKKYFSDCIFLFLFPVIAIYIQSCYDSKTVSSKEKKSAHVSTQKLPGSPSLSPKMFRVNAVLSSAPEIDSADQKIIYRLFIRDIIERGSSLSSPVAGGDIIETEATLLSTSVQSILKKGDEVIALLEERLKMNSDRPAFVVRDIHKK